MSNESPTDTNPISKFLNEDQNPNQVGKIYHRVKDLMTAGEEIEYIAVQKKPLFNFSPKGIAVTNKRIFVIHPRFFGLKMDFIDFLWIDVRQCHMKEEVFGAEFTAQTVNGVRIDIEYLPKAQARKVYQLSQSKEQVNREIRWHRELEEKRAASGAVVVANPSSSVPAAQSAITHTPDGTTFKQDDTVEALKKVKALREAGLLTDAEFEKKKEEILKRI